MSELLMLVWIQWTSCWVIITIVDCCKCKFVSEGPRWVQCFSLFVWNWDHSSVIREQLVQQPQKLSSQAKDPLPGGHGRSWLWPGKSFLLMTQSRVSRVICQARVFIVLKNWSHSQAAACCCWWEIPALEIRTQSIINRKIFSEIASMFWLDSILGCKFLFINTIIHKQWVFNLLLMSSDYYAYINVVVESMKIAKGNI